MLSNGPQLFLSMLKKIQGRSGSFHSHVANRSTTLLAPKLQEGFARQLLLAESAEYSRSIESSDSEAPLHKKSEQENTNLISMITDETFPRPAEPSQRLHELIPARMERA